ncbi:MAG: hypothetical protein KDD47_15785, partial [Acidobacteria bacterium]|nr:hypothetical protein [Acidobacteriota bacterium]
GLIDPLDGRSIYQLAFASRSNHRSQDMGTLQEIGPRTNRLIPVAGKATTEGHDPFTGVDTRLAAIAAVLPDGELKASVEGHLQSVEALAREARERLAPSHLAAAAIPLSEILDHLRMARDLLGDPEPPSPQRAVAELLDEKASIAQTGLAAAAGIVVDAFTDRGALVPGEAFRLSASLWNSSPDALAIMAVAPSVPHHWILRPVVTEGEPPAAWPVELGGGESRTWEWDVEVPAGAAASRPYFLERPLVGDLYDWSATAEEIRGEPFEPPPLAVEFAVDLGGRDLSLERTAVFRYRDQARGEIRRSLRVVPALEVALTPDLQVWPSSRREAVPFEVQLTNHRSEALEGELQVSLPAGWPTLEPQAFRIPAGGRMAMALALAPPSDLEVGDYPIRAQAVAGGEHFDLSVPLVSYDHIEPHPWPHQAESRIRIGRLSLPAVPRVGYIRGASDRVPEALQAIGVPLEVLSDEELAVGDLTRFPVIVVGSRAYETDPVLAEANGRLLDYVRAGGRLVVQYQQYQFVGGGFAPFPLEIERPHGRVTDETAAVTLLRPDHPIFHSPNLITEADWQDWVQERGLYFAGRWDEAYTPLLAMTDPDQPEQRGSLLVATVGKGTYIYTGLAFFRQLPAGVIGGYRLFLNLLDGRSEE